MASVQSSVPVRSTSFYNEYHGHTIEHLTQVHSAVRGERAVLWTLGDSTLDNKHWLLHGERQAATNGYERVLSPPHAVPDVAHALNAECVARGLGATHCAINCAVEEATLGGRARELLAQDAFVRDHVREQDVLIVSCGGNDIALRPTVSTIVAMGALLAMPRALIESLGSSPMLYRLVPGLGHFVSLFGATTARFVGRVVERTKPKAVVVCMLYYLDEVPGGSWADGTLRTLGYDTDPSKLQAIMRERLVLISMPFISKPPPVPIRVSERPSALLLPPACSGPEWAGRRQVPLKMVDVFPFGW